MKYIASLLFFSLILPASYSQDTIRVEMLDFSSTTRDTVVQFPDDGPYRKIIMQYGMRCHDLVVGNGNEGCREWDYKCNTVLYDSTRMDSILVDDGNGGLIYEKRTPGIIELLSFVTPYGNGLDLGPEGVMWEFDMTDYTPLLKGNKRIALIGGGEYQEEMKITFLFIKGIPEREVIDVRSIWRHSLHYRPAAIADDAVCEPREINIPTGVMDVKLKSVITGHEQKGEFTAFRHQMKVDDIAFDYLVWLNCQNIPVAPQGGTWIYPRAGWCPGDPSQIHEFWVPQDKIDAGQFTVDYSIPGTAQLTEAHYIVNNQMIWYGPINHQTDISVEEIMRPSQKIAYERINSSCFEPQVVVQNRGSEAITNFELEYGIDGQSKSSYFWTGDLDYGEKDTLILEYPSDAYRQAGGSSVFEVKIKTQDDQPDNNVMREKFERVPVFETDYFNILFTTNNRPDENNLSIVNEMNDTLIFLDDLQAKRTYFEELTLTPGCYRLRVEDSNGDGLYWWVYERNGSNVGRGALSLLADGIEVEAFNPDFGRSIQYEFLVHQVTDVADIQPGYFRAFPVPSADQVMVETKDYPYASQLSLISSDGKVWHTSKIKAGSQLIEIDISHLPSGHYQWLWSRKDQNLRHPMVITK